MNLVWECKVLTFDLVFLRIVWLYWSTRFFMSESIIITKAEPIHFQVIADIYNQYIDLGEATLDEHHKSSDDIKDCVSHMTNREGYFVLMKDTQVIGWSSLKRWSDRRGYRYAGEVTIYLSPDQIRQGYGTKICNHLLEWAREKQYKHLVAKIFADNSKSVRMFQKCGFTIVGVQKKIGFKNGKWKDVAIMQYVFE